MSGIKLLLEGAVDYERTHQLALFTLLTKSNLSALLFEIDGPNDARFEPEGQLFDLEVSNELERILIEIKMWSSLSEAQLQRQTEFLRKSGAHGAYVLLGTSWFELEARRIKERTDGLAVRVGYDELLDGLNRLLVSTDQPVDVYELALAYRNVLQRQHQRLLTAADHSQNRDQVYYYSLYRRLQQRLPDLKTRMFTVNNPGGPVYIFKNERELSIRPMGVAANLYYEVVRDELRMKFWSDVDDANLRRQLREEIRQALHDSFDGTFGLSNTGRLGKYMTACRLPHDFGSVDALEESASIFTEVGRVLPEAARRLGGA